MALKVEIDESQARLENIDERSGTKNGRNWSIRAQSIWVYEPGSKHPLRINLLLPEEIKIYPAGNYMLDLDVAFEQGNFHSISLNSRKMVLKPVK